jgi:hypothetical protein
VLQSNRFVLQSKRKPFYFCLERFADEISFVLVSSLRYSIIRLLA